MITIIRSAAPRDEETIEAIENAADVLLIERFHADNWLPARSGSSRLVDPGFVLVAETMSGSVVGFVHVLEIEGLAHVEQISVLPEHGRKGVGKQLLDAAIEHATELGYERMTLRTYADVPWNAPFYAGVGFVESDPTTDFHRHLVDVEDELGLANHGRRIQMTRTLYRHS